jgi:Mn-containing catalase
VASGNLLADFHANVAAEAQGRVQTARLWHMTDDPGVKAMLKFNLARDTYHQNMWLAAIEELQADGLEGIVAPNDLFDEEYEEHASELWHLSDGADADKGRWAFGTAPDGRHVNRFRTDTRPLGDLQHGPPPDPKLYVTYDGSWGEPQTPAFGTEKGVVGKLKDAVSPDKT